MNGPEAVARLLRGDPPDTISSATIEPPYDQVVQQLISGDDQERYPLVEAWLEQLLADQRSIVRQAITTAASGLDSGIETPSESLTNPYVAQLRTLADAYTPRPPIVQIVRGLLPARSLTIFFGSPASGKTNLLLDMAVAVATGTSWLPSLPGEPPTGGFPVIQSSVLWVDADSGEDVLAERLAAFGRAYHDPVSAPLYVLVFPTPSVEATKGLAKVAECAKTIKAGLIVFDNLLRIGGFRDENSSEVDAAMKSLRQLAEDTGAAVVVIHHPRKDPSGRAADTLRGHSSILAAVDAAFRVRRNGDHLDIDNTKARRKPVDDFTALWTCEHKADGETLEAARFYRVPDGAGKAPPQALLGDRILNAIRAAGRALNQSEVLDEIHARKRDVLQALEEQVRAGDLVETPGPHGSKLYALT